MAYGVFSLFPIGQATTIILASSEDATWMSNSPGRQDLRRIEA
jgi:hypothetical protein